MAKQKPTTPVITRVGDTVVMDTSTFDELIGRLTEAEAILDIPDEERARSWFRPWVQR